MPHLSYVGGVGKLGTGRRAVGNSFNPLDMDDLTFAFEARNQGLSDAQTTTTITDETGQGRSLTTDSATTFTYDAAKKALVKTTAFSSASEQVVQGFYGTTGTIIVIGRYVSGAAGIVGSLLNGSATFQILNTTTFNYRTNQAGAGVTAPGSYDLSLPYFMCVRYSGLSSARLRINNNADATFDPNDNYIANSAYRIGSLSGTTSSPIMEFFASYTFDRELSDGEVAQLYSYAQANFM